MRPITDNTLFYGDNLPILRDYIPTESVDLVYLDPPFNSNRNYNVLFKDEGGNDSEAQIVAFTDSWRWGPSAEQEYDALATEGNPAISDMISALRGFIGSNQMMAYLVMMTSRLVELHRVLKPTGSLYLHCDPTASHYLKIILDTIFGIENYRNEIIWKRRQGMHNTSRRFGAVTDTIFFYTRSDNYVFNKQFGEYDPDYIKKFFRFEDERGIYRLADLSNPADRPNLKYEYKGYSPPTKGWAVSKERMEKMDQEGRLYFPQDPAGRIQRKRYLHELEGQPVECLWDDIQPISPHSAEKLGYPTQKPLVLLERIIQASSREGDIILDPFCGCGTSIAAAQKLGRRWIGIDITHLSIALQKYRLAEMYPNLKFKVIGEPEDMGAAQQLFKDDAYQFQWWALSLVRARPYGAESGSKQGKKGADGGIDGIINFIDDASGKPKKVIIQVKGGKVQASVIRDLIGVLDATKGVIGVLITLEPPTKPMLDAATTAGFYESQSWGRKYPRVQIVTIAELFAGKEIAMPPAHGTFKQAQRVEQDTSSQQDRLDV